MNEVHIATIGGQMNVISVSSNNEPKVFKSEVTQVGLDAPVNNVIAENTTGATLTWSRTGAGQYVLTSSNPNLFSQTELVYSAFKTVRLITDLGQNLLGYGIGFIQVIAPNQLSLSTYDALAQTVAQDGMIASGEIEFEVYDIPNPTDSEESFTNIISGLDDNQLALWKKIVIRFEGTVTEVDGDKYRRTADFNASSKVINS